MGEASPPSSATIILGAPDRWPTHATIIAATAQARSQHLMQ
jgi:hypothetical protein